MKDPTFAITGVLMLHDLASENESSIGELATLCDMDGVVGGNIHACVYKTEWLNEQSWLWCLKNYNVMRELVKVDPKYRRGAEIPVLHPIEIEVLVEHGLSIDRMLQITGRPNLKSLLDRKTTYDESNMLFKYIGHENHRWIGLVAKKHPLGEAWIRNMFSRWHQTAKRSYFPKWFLDYMGI